MGMLNGAAGGGGVQHRADGGAVHVVRGHARVPGAGDHPRRGTRHYGSAVDWWTLGIFLYELNRPTLCDVIEQPLRFPSDGGSTVARDPIRGLLVKDPHKRIAFTSGATEIKLHPFFLRGRQPGARQELDAAVGTGAGLPAVRSHHSQGEEGAREHYSRGAGAGRRCRRGQVEHRRVLDRF
ncbi:hypothetical protein GUJ93_ZPchr0005g14241 [Zizania palustris]|uniref:non-specific serine/threonine protein kinase n=1 Tax=Zizania palustris TaxID=103762 RepID=A0A8J5SRM0_ZIZPA|nr:hypothetical protein GUJ93_ZPchr0005g14241 [Zizania palustris]